MTISVRNPLRLETHWTPSSENELLAYALTLTNVSDRPMTGFRLCISGPGRIDTAAAVENGSLHTRLSNYAEFAPPEGFVLGPNSSWTVTARGLSYPLRHWSEGTNTAYVVFEDGSNLPVTVLPSRSSGDNATPKRGADVYPVPDIAPVAVSIVPWPNQVSVTGRRLVPLGLAPHADSDEANQAIAAFAELTASLFPVEGLVRPEAEGGLAVNLQLQGDLGPEAYHIRFDADGAAVAAASHSGFLYGLITLGQMLRGARQHPQTFLFPLEGEIRDEPWARWRGTHLDVARQFYASAEVSQFLRILAWNKLNRLHWHLSDDEAWRIEIEAYPELTATGAWRGHGLAIPSLLGSGAAPMGGYYTKPVIRKVVALAAQLGIDIVPEIDMPGHCYSVLQSLPWLRDPAETGEYFSIQGFPNNCLNPGRAETYTFVETLIDELVELFPSKTIHIGGDEVPAGAWEGSPQAKAHLATLGSGGTPQLQADFLRRVQAMLTARGRITGAWEEASHGGGIDKANCYLNGWHTVEVSAQLAAEGYDIVVCPGQIYYLDMANSPAWSEPGSGWAGWSDPEKLYGFDPVEGWSEEQKQRFLGVQTCIWSEAMTDRGIFDRLIFPRISALAETGWTTPGKKSWDRFKALVGLMPLLYGIKA